MLKPLQASAEEIEEREREVAGKGLFLQFAGCRCSIEPLTLLAWVLVDYGVLRERERVRVRERASRV